MPDFMGKNVQHPTHQEKEYPNLYVEMLDKCNPTRFKEDSQHKFEVAYSIYRDLKEVGFRLDEELIGLRNRAIEELGLRFSPKRKYEYLQSFFDPDIYTEMDSCPAERVNKAKCHYDKMKACKDDLLALEALEAEASDFIKERQNEIDAEVEKRALERRKRQEEDEEDAKRMNKILLKVWIGLGILLVVTLIVSSL